MRIALMSLFSLAAAGCTVAREKTPDTAATGSGTERRASQEDSAATRPVGSSADAWLAHANGVGPVRIGMTAAEARTVLRLGTPASPRTEGCSYLAGTAETRLHANVMLTDDTVVRIDVLDTLLSTTMRAHVGDSEARIKQIYAGQVTVQPHKYTPGGHYLVVTEPDNANNRIVFETDGHVVTKYRVGREPEVENVEGCG